MDCGLHVLRRLEYLGYIDTKFVEEAEMKLNANGLSIRDLLEVLPDEWQGVMCETLLPAPPFIAAMKFGKHHHYVLVEEIDEKKCVLWEQNLKKFKLSIKVFNFFWNGIAICLRV